VLLALTAITSITQANILDVNLTSIGFNYAVPINISSIGRINAALTTANNNKLICFNSSYVTNDSLAFGSCQTFTEDQTSIYYILRSNLNCSKFAGKSVGTIGSASSMVPYVFTQSFYADNFRLHAWDGSTGNIGLAYNSYPKSGNFTPSAFQSILANVKGASLPMVFGLDFQSPQKANSSMQLGGLKPEYAQSTQWMYQPVNQPTNHQFFLENFTFCGISLLSNFSNNWPVVVDSGSVCVSLPGEIYDTFLTWLDNSTVVDLSQVNSLPTLSFQLAIDGNTNQLYHIPLSYLLINGSDIISEEGAPFIHIAGSATTNRLCVLRGSSIVGNNNQFNTPPISLGSLALRSMYFAADFDNFGVGLASKYSSGSGSGLLCQAKAVCVGDQSYWYGSNSCSEAACSNYFFTQLNASTHKCEFVNSVWVGGMFLIILIITLELLSYFIVQYTASSLPRVVMVDQNGEGMVPRYVVWVDPFTRAVGWMVTSVCDKVLIKCHSVRRRRPNNNVVV